MTNLPYARSARACLAAGALTLGVVEREKAALGVLISMREPTRPICAEAAAAGLYTSAGWHKSYPPLETSAVSEAAR